jgi:hypothetical protein
MNLQLVGAPPPARGPSPMMHPLPPMRLPSATGRSLRAAEDALRSASRLTSAASVPRHLAPLTTPTVGRLTSGAALGRVTDHGAAARVSVGPPPRVVHRLPKTRLAAPRHYETAEEALLRVVVAQRREQIAALRARIAALGGSNATLHVELQGVDAQCGADAREQLQRGDGTRRAVAAMARQLATEKEAAIAAGRAAVERERAEILAREARLVELRRKLAEMLPAWQDLQLFRTQQRHELAQRMAELKEERDRLREEQQEQRDELHREFQVSAERFAHDVTRHVATIGETAADAVMGQVHRDVWALGGSNQWLAKELERQRELHAQLETEVVRLRARVAQLCAQQRHDRQVDPRRVVLGRQHAHSHVGGLLAGGGLELLPSDP